jgi:hypothetical protein
MPSEKEDEFTWFIRNMQSLDRDKFTKAVMDVQKPVSQNVPDLEPEENTSDEE